ncbi:hypothetical protein V6N13_078739 [Hibiscus sabdariffa]|uniref:Uncharacterized protein n=1 Tax=Hibiscus sabdariffa TaxID=183260 RepID=A0ABR2RPQ1_9ROSI
MGNCIRLQKACRVNDNDDWGSLLSIYKESEGDDGGFTSTVERERLLGGGQNMSTREMRITISKKELELLVQKAEIQCLTLEQVLTNMVNSGGDLYEAEQPRPWKPVLQSIPEVN